MASWRRSSRLETDRQLRGVERSDQSCRLDADGLHRAPRSAIAPVGQTRAALGRCEPRDAMNEERRASSERRQRSNLHGRFHRTRSFGKLFRSENDHRCSPFATRQSPFASEFFLRRSSSLPAQQGGAPPPMRVRRRSRRPGAKPPSNPSGAVASARRVPVCVNNGRSPSRKLFDRRGQKEERQRASGGSGGEAQC